MAFSFMAKKVIWLVLCSRPHALWLCFMFVFRPWLFSGCSSTGPVDILSSLLWIFGDCVASLINALVGLNYCLFDSKCVV